MVILRCHTEITECEVGKRCKVSSTLFMQYFYTTDPKDKNLKGTDKSKM
jgi:hypothetical protein